MAHSRAVILPAGAGVRLPTGPTVTTLKVAGDDSAGRVGVVELEFGSSFLGPPRHVHVKIDHVWYVLAGRVAVTIGEQCVELEAGACAFVPKGTPHTIGNPGREVARVLEIDSPQTLERYFAELAQAFPAGARIDPAVVAAIQARHDTFIVGDPR